MMRAILSEAANPKWASMDLFQKRHLFLGQMTNKSRGRYFLDTSSLKPFGTYNVIGEGENNIHIF